MSLCRDGLFSSTFSCIGNDDNLRPSTLCKTLTRIEEVVSGRQLLSVLAGFPDFGINPVLLDFSGEGDTPNRTIALYRSTSLWRGIFFIWFRRIPSGPCACYRVDVNAKATFSAVMGPPIPLQLHTSPARYPLKYLPVFFLFSVNVRIEAFILKRKPVNHRTGQKLPVSPI